MAYAFATKRDAQRALQSMQVTEQAPRTQRPINRRRRLPRSTRGSSIRIAKVPANVTVSPGVRSIDLEVWDYSQNPPQQVFEEDGTTPKLISVAFQWIDDEQITEGKEVFIASIDGQDAIIGAQCEEPDDELANQ